jgi:hypothetical protein
MAHRGLQHFPLPAWQQLHDLRCGRLRRS